MNNWTVAIQLMTDSAYSKVHDQLVALNARYEALDKNLETKADEIQQNVAGRIEHLSRSIEAINNLLINDPQRSIVVRLDRLEQTDNRRTWLIRAAIASGLAGIVSLLEQLFKR